MNADQTGRQIDDLLRRADYADHQGRLALRQGEPDMATWYHQEARRYRQEADQLAANYATRSK